LSRNPAKFQGALWANNLCGDGGGEAASRRLAAAQSREDFAAFLALRGDEFRPGGYLVLGMQGCIDGTTQLPLYTCMEDAFSQLVRDGDIDGPTAAKLTIGEYIPTLPEVLEQLDGGPLGSVWEVVQAETHRVPCPFQLDFLQGKCMLSQCVDNQVNVGKAFANWVITAVLPQATVDRFWNLMRKKGIEDPTGSYTCTEHFYHTVILRRRHDRESRSGPVASGPKPQRPCPCARHHKVHLSIREPDSTLTSAFGLWVCCEWRSAFKLLMSAGN